MNSAATASPVPLASYPRTFPRPAFPRTLLILIRQLPASLTPKPLLLFYHFFAVAFYSLWMLFTRPLGERKRAPTVLEYPALMVQSVQVVSRRPP